MADLIIIAYDSEEKAEAARNKVLELQKEYLIEIGDAVVAVRRDDGHIKLNQLVNTTAAGAATGGMWGALVGLLFLNPLIGAALGAGALGGHFTDVGIDDKIYEGCSRSIGGHETCRSHSSPSNASWQTRWVVNIVKPLPP